MRFLSCLRGSEADQVPNPHEGFMRISRRARSLAIMLAMRFDVPGFRQTVIIGAINDTPGEVMICNGRPP